MPKGHSDIPPRLAALEKLVGEILVRLGSLEVRPAEGSNARVAILEKQVAAMNDAFSNGNLPRPQYESQFKVWPSANPASNGS
jgi:hypothetical protein